MITSGFSLAFNNKALLNNSKEMLWQRNIYQVTTSTDGHGSITATPMSGYQGTTVSLSNTPDAEYGFSGYSITGATLTDNQFIMNNDVTARAEFSALPTSALYWSKNTSDIATARSTVTVTVNADISEFNYCSIKFDHSASNAQWWAHDYWLDFNSFTWKGRSHYAVGDYKAVREGNTFTAENTAVRSTTQDGSTLRYDINVAEISNATYKFILDRNSNICSAFLAGTYLGYGSGAEGTTRLNSIKIASEAGGSVSMKNYYVAGFKNLSDAVNW